LSEQEIKLVPFVSNDININIGVLADEPNYCAVAIARQT